MQIADLHCDLLCYLAGNSLRSPYDPQVRCSISQLLQGKVKQQVMPIFTETAQGSEICGERQAAIFSKLHTTYPDLLSIDLRLAIENGSSFCGEVEDLEGGFERLARFHHEIGSIAYLSLTWNTENRFGGGALTSTGLKKDGEALLHFMDKKQIPLDLSHASDSLAYDSLNYIDKHRLNIRVIASHSNARSVVNVPRNLPDPLILEIVRRKGIIGINFIKSFAGCLTNQIQHFIRLGAEDCICFGADFFFIEDVPLKFRKSPDEYFYADYGNSGTYPKLITQLSSAGIPTKMLEKLSFENFNRFYLT